MARSIIGAGNVARVLASIFPWLVRIDVTVQPHEVNGQPGAIFRDRDSKVLFTLTLDVLDGQIQTVRSVSNPDKLGHLGPVGSGTTARRRAVSVPESRERAWRSYGALAAWRSGDLSARRLVIVSSRGDDAMRIPQLLARAEERIASLPLPDGELVFVHGDLWQGNTIWSGDSCSGMIDWDAVGAGSPGIDLGALRLDVALFFGSSALESPEDSSGPGSPAAGEVLAGWQQAAGRQAEHVAYWDVAAALCTVGDMA